MDKQEIEHKLDSYDKLVNEIQAKIEIMEKLKTDIQSQLAEAEKSKLGHGDFGIDEDTKESILIAPSQLPAHPMMSYNDETQPCGEVRDGRHVTRGIIKFGNIFDLMKEWGEDLEEFDVGGRHFKIYPEDPDSFLQIEEIWHKLGRMIFTRKRKQG